VAARFVLLEGSGPKVPVGTDVKQQERLYVVKYRGGATRFTESFADYPHVESLQRFR